MRADRTVLLDAEIGTIRHGLAHARALHGLGRKDEAKRRVAWIAAEIHARAAVISKIERRPGFMAGVPDHAHALALAAAW